MKINAISEINTINFEKREKIAAPQENAQERKRLSELTGKIFAPDYQRKYVKFQKGMQQDGLEMAELIDSYARKYVIYKDDKSKTALITKDHCYIAFLDRLLEFLRKVESGDLSYEKDATGCAQFLANYCSTWAMTKDNVPKTITEVEKEYKQMQKELSDKSVRNGFVSSVIIEKSIMKDIEDMVAEVAAEGGERKLENSGGLEESYIAAIMNSTGSKTKEYSEKIKNFFHRVAMVTMTGSTDEKPPVMPYYEEMANHVIKNADRNYNMFLTYSVNDESVPDYFISSLEDRIENLDDTSFKNLKKGKVKIVAFNDKARFYTIADECNNLSKDPDNQYFIIFKDFNKSFETSLSLTESGTPIINSKYFTDSIGTKAKNLHFVLMNNQDDYYNVLQQPVVEKTTRDYQVKQIPMMDSNTLTQQVLATKDYIKSHIDTDIDDEALTYITTLPLKAKGSGYDNVIRFIKNISSYYVDDKTITKDMAQAYWESTQRDDMASEDEPYDIVFDTKKTLDDIVGTPMVKKQAQKVVYELQNFPKTKGYILQTAGAQTGRLNCAKAIAGELEIPMICINAADFAMRDLDTINQDPMKAIEVKMNKLLNTMRTQAQANSRKMAMLYISNFDHFSSDPIYGLSSIYEQQAFQKLLKEMQKTYSDGSYNIVVMGASDYPQATNEAIMRPGLFMDSITMYPPETTDNIREIIEKHIDKMGYQFDDKEKVVGHFVKIMKNSQSDYIDNIYLLDKANILAHKRGTDEISIADINEAYLSTIAGEVPENMLKDVHKESLIRHEGGHALNLQFMYNLFKEREDNMRIGYSIVNVVLDPRGWYGGCVYPMQSYENMGEMNLETVMADIICDFGGNSAEEYFDGMEGSWGISQDRRLANSMARSAVIDMGLGARMKHYIPEIDPETEMPVLNSADEEDYVKDVKTILENSKIASDKIVKCYEDFLMEFSGKYLSRYGTGDCIVTGDEFALMLRNWEEKQPQKKKKEIARLKKEILSIIEYTKKGIIYTKANSINPIYRMF